MGIPVSHHDTLERYGLPVSPSPGQKVWYVLDNDAVYNTLRGKSGEIVGFELPANGPEEATNKIMEFLKECGYATRVGDDGSVVARKQGNGTTPTIVLNPPKEVGDGLYRMEINRAYLS